jgi:hypothetical protein
MSHRTTLAGENEAQLSRLKTLYTKRYDEYLFIYLLVFLAGTGVNGTFF